MSTTFYQRQADAKKVSARLIVLFAMAVTLIVLSMSGVTWFVTLNAVRPKTIDAMERQVGFRADSFQLPITVGLGTLAVIAFGSLYKVFELRRGGGTLVAESLGGRRISTSTQIPNERLLMNVVEEMAIASGVPVPPVFMMDEDGINAFAAGYSSSDAVLGVTRGCVDQLSRSELQGVIAHEFSHILNGDMRMSIKLIGVLHGILLIGVTGQVVLRGLFYSGGGSRRRSSKKEGGGGILVIAALAITAVIVGFIGVFFGNLIKAAVSRQREFLADASAVQFTRDPSGISGALQRIGGLKAGSRIENAGASEASHLFFSQAVWSGFGGLWATHPPLEDRIRAIDPSWKGKMLSGSRSQQQAASDHSKLTMGFAENTTSSSDAPLQAIHDGLGNVGEPTLQHQQYAAALIDDIPVTLLSAIREAYGARAVIFCLLLDSDLTIKNNQRKIIRQEAGDDVLALVNKLQKSVMALGIQKRLPVIDLALASLSSLSNEQYRSFISCFNNLVKADQKLDLFEWVMVQIIKRHLKPHFEKTKRLPESRVKLMKMRAEVEVVLSSIAAAGNSKEEARQAFDAGASSLPELSLQQTDEESRTLGKISVVLKRLRHASAEDRRRIIDACAVAVEADGHITWQEAELLRGIADLLDCPIPPILPSANL